MALQEYYNTGDNGWVSMDTTHWDTQTFTTGSEYDATSVKLLLFRHSTYAPGIITVSIRAVSGSPQTSVPTGADLVVGTTDGNTLTTNTAGEWREITFPSPLALSDATLYAIVVVCENVGGFALKWRGASTGAYAPGNRASSSDGSSWTGSVRDNIFEVYGTSTTYSELSGTIIAASTVSGNIVLQTAVELSGTVAAVSNVGNASLGQVAVSLGDSVVLARLVAVGNNRLYYEDIP